MPSEQLYTVRRAFQVALIAGGLGATVATLIALGAPSWTWIVIVAFCLVVGIVFLAALGYRDPEARLRGFVVRTVVFVGAMLIAKATTGLAIDAVGKLDADPVLSAAGRLVFGSSWQLDLACLAVGLVLLLVAMREVARRPAAEAPMTLGTGDARIEEPPASVPPLPEVFHERVRMLFERRAFTSFQLHDYRIEQGCLVGECRDDRGTCRVVVRCDDRNVEISDADLAAVAAYATSLPGGAEARVCYATPGARAVNAEIQNRFPHIEFVSEEDLLDNLVHFDGYLRRLIERYEQDRLPYSTSNQRRTLAETFVAPQYTLQGAAGEVSRTGLREYLDEWLADSRPRQIALLANYGMGKSSFLKHYAAYLARRWLDGGGGRIPILLSLTGKSPRTSPGVEGLVQAFIAQYQLRCEFTAFELLMRAGRLVFLIDAFDEMDLVGDRGMRMAHFAALWCLHMPGNKLLFAGRQTFFPDDEELREALHIAAVSSERMTGRGYCERVSLAQLADEDIESSFVRYFAPGEGARHFAWVRGNQRLLELARRPAMMHIIRDTIEELRASGADSIALREAALLKLYTDHWIERQIEGSEPAPVLGASARLPRRQLLVSREIRAQFSENLAVWMFANARSDVKSAELSELFVEWFPQEAERVASGGGAITRPQISQRTHLIEGIETDLRNCTFLIADQEGKFAFAHKPFFEYFIATAIDRCLREKRHLPSSLQARPWSIEISLHVADLWLLRRNGADASEEEARWIFKALTRRSAGRSYVPLDAAFHPTLVTLSRSYPKRRRHARWRRALAPILSLTSVFDNWPGSPQMRGIQVLLRGGVPFVWIQRHLFSRVLGWLGGVAHAPRCLEALDLSRARLDGAALEELDFAEKVLIGASFMNARIQRCCFDHADLSGVDFRRAVLSETSFMRSKLQLSRFDEAAMRACRFDRADAREARFDGATLAQGSSMRFMSARRASLKGVKLADDLRGLDAFDADLAMSDVSGSDTTAARLPSDPVPTTEMFPALLRHASSISWSPDDTMLLALDLDSAWLLSAGDLALIRRFIEPSGPILAASFRSKTEIVTVSHAGLVSIHELATGVERRLRLDVTPHRVALDPSGTWLAAAHGSFVIVARCDGKGMPWSASLQSRIIELAVASDGAFFVAILEHETWIVGQNLGARHILSPSAWDRVQMDPRGEWFALTNNDGTEIYEVEAFGEAAAHVSNANLKPRPITSLHAQLVGISPDGTRLVGHRDSQLVFWSRDTWKEERSLLVPIPGVSAVACTHGSSELAYNSKYMILVVDARRDGAFCTLVPFASEMVPNSNSQIELEFIDEEVLLTQGFGGTQRWNLRELRSETPLRPPELLTKIVLEKGKPTSELDDPFSPMPGPGGVVIGMGARRLAYLRYGGEQKMKGGIVEVYETERREMLASIPVGASASHASFHQHGNALAFESDNHLIVFDLVERRELMRSELSGVTAVAYLPDRSTVVAGDEEGQFHVFDVASGEKCAELRVAGARISSIVVAAVGPVFVAAADGTISSWMRGADLIEPFTAALIGTTRLAVSPGGSLLAGVSRDDIVRVWNVADRTLAMKLYHLHNGWAVVRGDGKYRYGGFVWQLASSRGLRAYRFEDLDVLIPDQRL